MGYYRDVDQDAPRGRGQNRNILGRTKPTADPQAGDQYAAEPQQPDAGYEAGGNPRVDEGDRREAMSEEQHTMLGEMFDIVCEIHASVREQPAAASDGEVEALRAEIAQLNEELERRDRAIEALAADYQRLGAGIEDARKDTIAALLAPAAKNLVGLLKHSEDALLQDLEAVDADSLRRQISGEYHYLVQQARDTLEALGFEEVEVNPGDAVDGKQHKTLSVVATDDESLHNTVKEVQVRGFKHPGSRSPKPAFPAHVVAYRYDSGTA